MAALVFGTREISFSSGESTAADMQLAYLAGVARAYPAGYGFAMLAFTEELWPTAELVCTAQTIPEEGVRYYLCQNGVCAQPMDSILKVELALKHS